jgi:hypothetical protein
MCAMRKEVTAKPRDAIYVSLNIKARMLYHCCRAEKKSIKLRIVSLCLYPQFSSMQITSFLLLIYIVICVVSDSTTFFHIVSQMAKFSEKRFGT